MPGTTAQSSNSKFVTLGGIAYLSSDMEAATLNRRMACDREPDLMIRKSLRGWRHRFYELLEQGPIGDWESRLAALPQLRSTRGLTKLG